jgi:glutamyl-tRNA reductase
MIGVIGTSHRIASLQTLERVATAFSMHDAVKNSGVLLQTCNRIEWYFSTQPLLKTHEDLISFLRPRIGNEMYALFTLFGAECLYHLGKVSSGLDSVFVGETEIQGQVKEAYESARKNHPLSKELHFLFQKALHTGKEIRGLTQGPDHNTFTEEVVQLVTNHLKTQSHHVLLIGSSMTNWRIGSALVKTGIPISISNRTEENAENFAHKIGGRVLPWCMMEEKWHHFPCVITATKSTEYLLRSGKAPDTHQLLIDLGMPRNIDPSLASTDRKLCNIESFKPSKKLDSILLQRTECDFHSLTQRSSPVNKENYARV